MSGLLSIGGLMGHSTLSGLINGALSLISLGDLQRQQNESRADNRAMFQGSNQLAAATGNEKVPGTANFGSLGDISLGYNPVQDLLNYQNDIRTQMATAQTGAESRLKDFMGGQLSTYDANSKMLLGDYQRGMAPVDAALRARYQRGLDTLQGMGDSARRDINRAYDSSMGSQSAALSARGLGNSTLLANAMTGNERNRQASLGALDESLRAQRLSTDANLSGDVINNQRSTALGANTLLQSLTSGRQSLAGGLGANLLDLKNQNANANIAFNSAIGQQRQNLGNQANANQLSILSGTQIAYPDAAMTLNAISNAFSGLGSYKGTEDAMNIQDKQFEQALTAGIFGNAAAMPMAMGGAYFGGLGYGLAGKTLGGSGGGGGYMGGGGWSGAGWNNQYTS